MSDINKEKTCDNCGHKNESFGVRLNFCRWCTIQEDHICHDDNWIPKKECLGVNGIFECSFVVVLNDSFGCICVNDCIHERQIKPNR